MAQVLNYTKNPWARLHEGDAVDNPAFGWDPQRTDLFTIDFSSALTAMQEILRRVAATSSVAAQLYEALPTRESLALFPVVVALPERHIRSEATRRHDIPYPNPGYDDELAAIGVTWFLECGADDAARSSILAFLRTWQAVTRAGRAGQNPGELALDLQAASRSGTGFIPNFRHDFTISLWRGTGTRSNVLVDTYLELSQRWQVRAGWLAGIHLPELRANQPAAVAEVRTAFHADTVVEI